MARPTSFRLPEALLDRLDDEASATGSTLTGLVAELLEEGLAVRRHPGLVFRGGASGRRAAIAGGPDVWEVIRDLQHLEGTQDVRLRALQEATGVEPRQAQVAVDYYLDHADEVDARIVADEAAAARVRLRLERRAQLFAS